MSLFWKQKPTEPNVIKGVDLTAEQQRNNTKNITYNQFPSVFFSLGKPLLIKASKERRNQLESKPLFDATFIETKPLTKQIIELSDFDKLRQRMARETFFLGEKYLALIPYQGSYIMDAWNIVPSGTEKVGSIYTKLVCISSTNVEVNGVEVPLQAEITFKNGITRIDYFYQLVNNKGEVSTMLYNADKPIIYPKTSRMVGQVFKANEYGRPELEDAFEGTEIAEIINYLSQEIVEETMRTKTWWELNTNFADREQDEHEKLLRSGKATMTASSFNQKLQTGQGVILSGSQATTFSQISYSFVEDKVKEYIGMYRDTMGTSTNKHSLEVSMTNQYATDTMLSLRTQREEEYKALFRVIEELTGETDLASSITLKLSDTEQAKLDMLTAKVASANKGATK